MTNFFRMNKLILRHFKLYLSAFLMLTFLFGCSTSKGLKKYSIDTTGVIAAHPDNMNKDIIRLKGDILSNGTKVKDHWQFVFKVKEIIKYGPTFATVAPEIGEEVVLYTPGEVKFKKNSEVVLDALTPINRGEGKLVINMVIE